MEGWAVGVVVRNSPVTAVPPAPGASDRTTTRRTYVRRCPGARRSDRNRRATPTWPTRNGADDGPGCEPRPDQWRGRSQTPRAAGMRMDREETCTTALRPGPDDLPPSTGERHHDPGCARSSGQTVTALVATGLEDGATRSGAHPLTEPVLLGTTTIVGLECALHAILLRGTDAAVQGQRSSTRGCWRTGHP